MRKTIQTAASIGMLALSCSAFNVSASFVDCTQCHNEADFLSKYNRETNHATGVGYPSAFTFTAGYNIPDGNIGDIVFFDANGNGFPDEDEIQLFGTTSTVECSSCHEGHDGAPPPSGTPPSMYLRVSAQGSAICAVCHRL